MEEPASNRNRLFEVTKPELTCISVPSVLTARFIREAVKADLVRRVAENATPEILAELEDQIARQRSIAENNTPAEFMKLGEAFHRARAGYAGGPAVSDYLKGLNIQMNRARNISARQFAPGKLVAQHAAIVQAMGIGDSEAAEVAMRVHLQQIIKDLPQIVEAYPDYFEETQRTL